MEDEWQAVTVRNILLTCKKELLLKNKYDSLAIRYNHMKELLTRFATNQKIRESFVIQEIKNHKTCTILIRNYILNIVLTKKAWTCIGDSNFKK